MASVVLLLLLCVLVATTCHAVHHPSRRRAALTPELLATQFPSVAAHHRAHGYLSLQELQATGALADRFQLHTVVGGGRSTVDMHNQRVARANATPWIGPVPSMSLLETQTRVPTTKRFKAKFTPLTDTEGAFGNIFKGVDQTTQQPVIVKLYGVTKEDGFKPSDMSQQELRGEHIIPKRQHMGVNPSEPEGDKIVVSEDGGEAWTQEVFAWEYEMFLRVEQARHGPSPDGSDHILGFIGVLWDPGHQKGDCAPVLYGSRQERLRKWQFSTMGEYEKLFPDACRTNIRGLVLEYCPHGNLESHIFTKKAFQNVKIKRNALRDIERAIAFLHHHYMYHLDIKPDNVVACDVVDNEYDQEPSKRVRYKLIDFGIADAIAPPQRGTIYRKAENELEKEMERELGPIVVREGDFMTNTFISPSFTRDNFGYSALSNSLKKMRKKMRNLDVWQFGVLSLETWIRCKEFKVGGDLADVDPFRPAIHVPWRYGPDSRVNFYSNTVLHRHNFDEAACEDMFEEDFDFTFELGSYLDEKARPEEADADRIRGLLQCPYNSRRLTSAVKGAGKRWGDYPELCASPPEPEPSVETLDESTVMDSEFWDQGYTSLDSSANDVDKSSNYVEQFAKFVSTSTTSDELYTDDMTYMTVTYETIGEYNPANYADLVNHNEVDVDDLPLYTYATYGYEALSYLQTAEQYRSVADHHRAHGLASVDDWKPHLLAGRFSLQDVVGGNTGMVDAHNQRVAKAKGEPWIGPVSSFVDVGTPVDTALGAKASRVGKGSFGSVYRAQDTKTKQPVAIKLASVSRDSLVLSSLAKPLEDKYDGETFRVDVHQRSMAWEYRMYLHIALIQAGPGADGKDAVAALKGVIWADDGDDQCFLTEGPGWGKWVFSTMEEYEARWRHKRCWSNIRGLVFELCQQDLQTVLLTDKKFQVAHKKRAALDDIRKSLTWLHRHDFFHRDIKPDNIMQCGETRVRGTFLTRPLYKLIDLGLMQHVLPRRHAMTINQVLPPPQEQIGAKDYELMSSAIENSRRHFLEEDVWQFGLVSAAVWIRCGSKGKFGPAVVGSAMRPSVSPPWLGGGSTDSRTSPVIASLHSTRLSLDKCASQWGGVLAYAFEKSPTLIGAKPSAMDAKRIRALLICDGKHRKSVNQMVEVKPGTVVDVCVGDAVRPAWR